MTGRELYCESCGQRRSEHEIEHLEFGLCSYCTDPLATDEELARLGSVTRFFGTPPSPELMTLVTACWANSACMTN